MTCKVVVLCYEQEMSQTLFCHVEHKRSTLSSLHIRLSPFPCQVEFLLHVFHCRY